MKKKTGIIFAAVIAASVLFGAHAMADDITVMVNGSQIHPETPAVIVESRTLVPLRAITEALGCDVAWNGSTRGITLADNSSFYFMWIERDHVFKTSAVALQDSTIMNVPPVIMDDYTMVPLRAISEIFGAQVGWNGDTRTVTVDYATQSVEPGRAASAAAYEKKLYEMYDAYKAYADGNAGTVKAQIQLENGGNIDVELYGDIAPITVANFVKLVNDKFYDGLIFHRVIKDFMIQGGGFGQDYVHKEAPTITGEFIMNGHFNLIPHERGVLSMARTSVMNSASSQFFIIHATSPHLDGQYAAFGKVTSGMEYVDQIANCETESNPNVGDDDVPKEQQIIKTIVIK